MWLAGFGPLRKSAGVHDPITARALALRRGDVTAVVVAVDLIGLHHHTVEAIRDRLAGRADRDAVIVAATHNHEGPDTLGLWGAPPLVSGIDAAYLAAVVDGAAAAAEAALDRLGPVRVAWGAAEAPAAGVTRNRRDPDLIDRTVTALAFDRPDGAPVATLVHFTCHPEVLGSRNTLVSADLPGPVRRAVEEGRPGGVAVFLNGALGGMVTSDERGHTFAEVERIGGEVGRLALAALAGGAALPPELDLAVARRPVWVPVQNRSYLWADLFGVFGDRPFEGGYTPSDVTALRLGPVVLLTAYGEALPRVGAELASLSAGEPTLVVGLGGDELGYLIHEDDFDRERYDYERTVSPGPLATTLLRREAAAALADVGASAARGGGGGAGGE